MKPSAPAISAMVLARSKYLGFGAVKSHPSSPFQTNGSKGSSPLLLSIAKGVLSLVNRGVSEGAPDRIRQVEGGVSRHFEAALAG